MAFVSGLIATVGSLIFLTSIIGIINPRWIRRETKKEGLKLLVISTTVLAVGGALAPSPAPASDDVEDSTVPTFTVREYEIYREVIHGPGSEDEALRRVASDKGITVEEAKVVSERVMAILLTNKWSASPEAEIQRASDWDGPKPSTAPMTTKNALGIVGEGLDPKNKLGVRTNDLRTMRNPKGDGIFVYVKQTRFYGVERHLLWLAISETAYALNGSSKELTPDLKWPREAPPGVWDRTNLDMYSATEAIETIFGK